MKIPREHGLYVVLVSSWLIGLVDAETAGIVPSLVVLLAAVATVLLQAPARDIIGRGGTRRRFPPREDRVLVCTIALILLACTIYMVIDTPEVIVPGTAGILLTGIYLWMYRHRGTMIGQSLTGFLGATLVAPATHLVADRQANIETVALLWGMTAAYFCSSVYAVRIRLDGRSAMRRAIAYHVATTLLLTVPIFLDRTSPLYLLPMGIAWLRLIAIRIDVERWQALPLKRIGLLESAAAAIIVAIMMAAGSRFIFTNA